MNTLSGICARILNLLRLSPDQQYDGVDFAREFGGDFPSRDRIEFAMWGMSDADAHWYYERLRWRA